MPPQITLERVSRSYAQRVGLWRTLSTTTRDALNSLTCQIETGQRVALVGPNGAGKSTLIKLLCGIIAPSSGKIDILGRTPHLQRQEHVRDIGVVFGQRTQLAWDISPRHTYDLLAALHEIPHAAYIERLVYYCGMFEANDLVDTPTRQLSLGQRMRCDLIAALLHNPAILLLDEPSIGLDLSSKNRLHQCLNRYTAEHDATLLLSSHDIDDIELCDRVLVLHEGRLVLDTTFESLQEQHAQHPILFRTESALPPNISNIQYHSDHYRCSDWSTVLDLQRTHPDIQILDAQEAPFRLRQLLEKLMP